MAYTRNRVAMLPTTKGLHIQSSSNAVYNEGLTHTIIINAAYNKGLHIQSCYTAASNKVLTHTIM